MNQTLVSLKKTVRKKEDYEFMLLHAAEDIRLASSILCCKYQYITVLEVQASIQQCLWSNYQHIAMLEVQVPVSPK